MIRGFAAIFGATSAISRSSAAIAALVHLSSTSIAFSHSITMVTAGRVVFLAMAKQNIGSAGRQATTVISLKHALTGFACSPVEHRRYIARSERGTFAPTQRRRNG